MPKNSKLRRQSNRLTRQNKDLPWVKRKLEGNKLSIPWGDDTASHQLSYASVDDGYMIYPNIIQQGDSLVAMSPDEALQYAIKNNTGMFTKDSVLADYYSRNGLINHEVMPKKKINKEKIKAFTAKVRGDNRNAEEAYKYLDWSNADSKFTRNRKLRNFAKGDYNPESKEYAIWMDAINKYADYGKTGLKEYPGGGTVTPTNTISPDAHNPAFLNKFMYDLRDDEGYTIDDRGYPVTDEILQSDPYLSSLKVKPTWYTNITNEKGVTTRHPSYTKEEIDKYGWDMKNPDLPEMSFGGILADAAMGAGSGAIAGTAIPIPLLGNAAGAVIGGAVGLVKGLKGHFAEKKLEKQQAKLDKQQTLAHGAWATGAQNYQMMNNPFASTFPMGGQIPYGPNVELEKEEVFQRPDGSVGQVDAPTHSQGGQEMALEPGTKVYSDRLKASTGKTFAEEAEKIKKQMAKYEKMLS